MLYELSLALLCWDRAYQFRYSPTDIKLLFFRLLRPLCKPLVLWFSLKKPRNQKGATSFFDIIILQYFSRYKGNAVCVYLHLCPWSCGTEDTVTVINRQQPAPAHDTGGLHPLLIELTNMKTSLSAALDINMNTMNKRQVFCSGAVTPHPHFADTHDTYCLKKSSQSNAFNL